MSTWRDYLDPDAPAGRYLAWKDVAKITGLSRTTAWRSQRIGEFPRPYPISAGRVGFLENELEAWKAWRRDRSVGATVIKGRPAASVAPARQPSEPVRAASTSPAAVTVSASTPAIEDPAPERRVFNSQPPSAKPRRRRRSQHARAIAQQIMFDF